VELAADIEGYLERIGYTGSRQPVLATLADIQLRHTLTLAFENLDPLLKRPVRLDLTSLEEKLLRQRRGGYCYEHNILLQAVLVSLGFTVTGLAARVLWNAPPAVVRARTHMLLKVDLPEGSYLVDAGFGAMTPSAPLALTPGPIQQTPHENFRLVQQGELLRLEGQVEEHWKPLYSFDLQPQELPDYEAASWYVSTHPASSFISVLMAAHVTPDGRHGLYGNQLSWHPSQNGYSGPGRRRTLDNAAALRQALEEVFGICLPADPGLEALLAQQALAPPP
jgi:N-hydroxyarylamine O-acetyltransferase